MRKRRRAIIPYNQHFTTEADTRISGMTTDSSDQTSDCDGLVLSGGRGSRVGGRDKGLLPVGNVSAAERAVALLRPHCRRILISANRNLDRYGKIADADIVVDRRGEYLGPLAALEAAGAEELAPFLLILPNDLPRLNPKLPGQLLKYLRSDTTGTELVYASDGNRAQYLCACARSACLTGIGELLERGEHRVREWLVTLRTHEMLFPAADDPGLQNFNKDDQWSSLDASGDMQAPGN